MCEPPTTFRHGVYLYSWDGWISIQPFVYVGYSFLEKFFFGHSKHVLENLVQEGAGTGWGAGGQPFGLVLVAATDDVEGSGIQLI